MSKDRKGTQRRSHDTARQGRFGQLRNRSPGHFPAFGREIRYFEVQRTVLQKTGNRNILRYRKKQAVTREFQLTDDAFRFAGLEFHDFPEQFRNGNDQARQFGTGRKDEREKRKERGMKNDEQTESQ